MPGWLTPLRRWAVGELLILLRTASASGGGRRFHFADAMRSDESFNVFRQEPDGAADFAIADQTPGHEVIDGALRYG
jgi:hypothetical protein